MELLKLMGMPFAEVKAKEAPKEGATAAPKETTPQEAPTPTPEPVKA
jgi:hypothetical protein